MCSGIDALHSSTRHFNTGVPLDGRDTVLLQQQRQKDRALQQSSLRSSLLCHNRQGEGLAFQPGLVLRADHLS